MEVDDDAAIAFRIEPQPQSSRMVRDNVADFAGRHAIREDDLGYFLTALAEAIANAIEHANTDTPIEVEVRVEPGQIVATVQDGGVGFDVDLSVPPALPDSSAERGRGLPIMRRCSDIFTIESVPGRGTAVVLGRFLRPGEQRGAA